MTLAALAGVLVGLVLGLLGAGGAIIAVPALVYLLGKDAHQATTSSLLIVGVTAAIATLAHARRGHVRWGDGLVFAAVGTLGTVLGSNVSSRMPPDVLLLVFAGLMLVVATVMFRRRCGQGEERPGERRGPVVLAATAAGVGLLTGLLGVGGGFAVVPALVLALGYPMPVAVGTSLLVITVNSATAFLERLRTGVQLDVPVVAVFTVVAVVASLAGARLGSCVPACALQRGFSALLVVVGLYMGATSALALR